MQRGDRVSEAIWAFLGVGLGSAITVVVELLRDRHARGQLATQARLGNRERQREKKEELYLLLIREWSLLTADEAPTREEVEQVMQRMNELRPTLLLYCGEQVRRRAEPLFSDLEEYGGAEWSDMEHSFEELLSCMRSDLDVEG